MTTVSFLSNAYEDSNNGVFVLTNGISTTGTVVLNNDPPDGFRIDYTLNYLSNYSSHIMSFSDCNNSYAVSFGLTGSNLSVGQNGSNLSNATLTNIYPTSNNQISIIKQPTSINVRVNSNSLLTCCNFTNYILDSGQIFLTGVSGPSGTYANIDNIAFTPYENFIDPAIFDNMALFNSVVIASNLQNPTLSYLASNTTMSNSFSAMTSNYLFGSTSFASNSVVSLSNYTYSTASSSSLSNIAYSALSTAQYTSNSLPTNFPSFQCSNLNVLYNANFTGLSTFQANSTFSSNVTVTGVFSNIAQATFSSNVTILGSIVNAPLTSNLIFSSNLSVSTCNNYISFSNLSTSNVVILSNNYVSLSNNFTTDSNIVHPQVNLLSNSYYPFFAAQTASNVSVLATELFASNASVFGSNVSVYCSNNLGTGTSASNNVTALSNAFYTDSNIIHLQVNLTSNTAYFASNTSVSASNALVNYSTASTVSSLSNSVYAYINGSNTLSGNFYVNGTVNSGSAVNSHTTIGNSGVTPVRLAVCGFDNTYDSSLYGLAMFCQNATGGTAFASNSADICFDRIGTSYVGMGWQKGSNNTFGFGPATNVLTTDFSPSYLQFYKNSAAIIIPSNLAVGKSNPAAYALDVTGDINFTGSLRSNGVIFSGGGASGFAFLSSNLYTFCNVGVNTSNPAYPLDVVGNLRSTKYRFTNTNSYIQSILDISGAAVDGIAIMNTASSNPSISTLNNTGYVGIGMSNPFVPLHVFSTVGSGGMMRIQQTTSNECSLSYSNTQASWVTGIGPFSTGSNFTIATVSGNSGAIITCTQSDNVGINTSTPGITLDVNGKLGTTTNNNTTTPSIGISGGIGDRVILFPGTGSTYPYSLGISSYTSWTSVPVNSQFQWFTGGNIGMTLSNNLLGVGTSNPQRNLEVVSALRISSFPAVLDFGSDFNTQIYRDGASNMIFTTSGANRLFIGSNGNIGINTTTPQWPLDVNGSLFASNVYTRGGFVVSSNTPLTLESGQNQPIVMYIQGGNFVESNATNNATSVNNFVSSWHYSSNVVQSPTVFNSYISTTSATIGSYGLSVAGTTNLQGNIGFNTASPKYELDFGLNAAQHQIGLYTGNGQFYGFGCGSPYTYYFSGGGSNGGHAWYNYCTSNNYGSNLMTLNSIGLSVGNLTGPSYTLDVAGSMRVSSTAYLNNMCSSTNNGTSTMYILNANNGNVGYAYALAQDSVGNTYMSAQPGCTVKLGINASYFLTLSNGMVGVNTQSPAYTLDVAGSAHATSFPTSSDIRFKKNIEPLSNVLDRLQHIRGVTFNWNELHVDSGRGNYDRQIGFIAQEVEAHFPEVITHWTFDSNIPDARAIDYSRMTAVLHEAIKEQNTLIRNLRTDLEILRSEVWIEKKSNFFKPSIRLFTE